MFSIVTGTHLLRAALLISAGPLLCAPAGASAPPRNDGSVILRMCQGADKVKMLSVMCHSYLNGYIDAAHHYGKAKAAFCLDANDKKIAPGVLVEWLGTHPESLAQPAPEVLQRALTEKFPCKASK